MTLEHSRGLLLASEASGRSLSDLEAALESSRVVVSVDQEMPMALLTLRVLLTTMRRGPGNLVLERGALASGILDDLADAVAAIDPDRPLEVLRNGGDSATVRLHLGTASDRAIRLVPEGFGAHVAARRSAVIRPGRPGNPLGAVYTAALGAAEAFTRVADVLPSRRSPHHHLRFCPLALSSDLAVAPELPSDLALEFTLIGVGAIGTGIVLLLGALGATGRLVAVDHQRFHQENRGTYSLGGQAEVLATPWKVDLARAALPAFDVTPFYRAVEELPAAIDAGEIPWLPTVMTALDTPDARRHAQRLWPDRLIDAATGDTMLGIHDHKHGDGPCLLCFFPLDHGGPSAAERLAQATGLSIDRAMRGDDPLTQGDLEGLSEEQQELLLPYLGRPVCGLAQAVGLTALEADGYQPSIAFVSLQAACLAVGRLLAAALRHPPKGNLVQYDGLFGPQAATIETMQRRHGCICKVRAEGIEAARAQRRRVDA